MLKKYTGISLSLRGRKIRSSKSKETVTVNLQETLEAI